MPIEDFKHDLATHTAELALYRAQLPQIRAEGEAALRRLFEITYGESGQCGRVARFLLGLYNGDRFPFDLTELRGLDRNLFADCLTVLRMDHSCEKEVHKYFPEGGKRFEALACEWTTEGYGRRGRD